MRKIEEITFHPEELKIIKRKVLYWLKAYSTFIYLDNNAYRNAPNRFELLAGAGVRREVAVEEIDAVKGDWLFGHIGYDFKNTIFPRLHSRHTILADFPATSFYVPDVVISIPFGSATLQVAAVTEDPAVVLQAILATVVPADVSGSIQVDEATWVSDFDSSSYMDTVGQLRQHITEGDCYEINLCNGHRVTVRSIRPYELFDTLNGQNPAPFAAFCRYGERFLLSTSPERYLYREGATVLSQPIKGTTGRSADPLEDERQRTGLYHSIKERAENVMITDLVRNDLARICETGSIEVPELFGVYTFSSLHHLISTVQGRLLPGSTLRDIITIPFPMGSMTGAPKYIVMQLIEQYERSARGIFSGTVGYITPSEDFDFNVVIRSLVYDGEQSVLSLHTGGAITIDSDAAAEWNEASLKALRLKQVMGIIS